jgi:hypothetical protein
VINKVPTFFVKLTLINITQHLNLYFPFRALNTSSSVSVNIRAPPFSYRQFFPTYILSFFFPRESRTIPLLTSPRVVLLVSILYSTMAVEYGRIFIYGGKGELGSACVKTFKSKNWVSFLNLHNVSWFRNLL